MAEKAGVDELDVALLQALTDHPRAGALELARLTGVARATVTARIDTLERNGVVTGYGPDIDLVAAASASRHLSLSRSRKARSKTSSTTSAKFLECLRHTRPLAPATFCAGSRPARTKHCNGFSSR